MNRIDVNFLQLLRIAYRPGHFQKLPPASAYGSIGNLLTDGLIAWRESGGYEIAEVA